mgnify:FL=1
MSNLLNLVSYTISSSCIQGKVDALPQHSYVAPYLVEPNKQVFLSPENLQLMETSV